MRKLVLILIAFIAVVTFIRAFDNSYFTKNLDTDNTSNISESISDLNSKN